MAKTEKEKAKKRLIELANREAKLERELTLVRESMREIINNHDLNKSES